MRWLLAALIMFSITGNGNTGELMNANNAETTSTLADFSESPLPSWIRFNNVRPGAIHEMPSGAGLEVHFARVDWPNVYFRAPEDVWDWTDYAGVGVSLYNPGDVPVTVAMRLDNEGADGINFCDNLRANVLPRSRFAFNMLFPREGERGLWGMRGIPGEMQYGEGAPLDLTRITAFQLFLPQPQMEHTLILERAYLLDKNAAAAGVPFPFVDAFGQYIHEDWPGKLISESAFAERIAQEQKDWEQQPELPGRDRFGGWSEGPRREATGWFRTEKIDGKWWLITPEGTLFLSFGMDCVGTWERTFVEGREDWFAWLPDAEDPRFGGLYAQVSGAHSMAEPIGGTGRTFSFYGANLVRKYGAEWKTMWRESVYPRLRHWGFNTIANWSQEDVLAHSDMPFVASTGLHQVREIESATGYWRKMMDVYDPSFEENVASAVAYIAGKYATNPLCIGYFVDNELAWEGVVDGVLASGEGQPARQALMQRLKSRYGSIESLNQAWGLQLADWAAIDGAVLASDAARQDISDFFHAFSLRYFSVIRDAFRRHAPNQLYLGCRFSTTPDEAVRACAEAADVVSFNLYYPRIPQDLYAGEKDLGKPMIIGEFHFGALDRGMFHTGLVATKDQNDRAAHYEAYVRSVVDHPGFVGCHWFQYMDEPITGRWFDGENYNIGFLDVTDTPYPELVKAAQHIHGEAYGRRFGVTIQQMGDSHP